MTNSRVVSDLLEIDYAHKLTPAEAFDLMACALSGIPASVWFNRDVLGDSAIIDGEEVGMDRIYIDMSSAYKYLFDNIGNIRCKGSNDSQNKNNKEKV